MNKEAAYPWIFAAIGGLIGLLVAITVSNCISYFPYSLDDNEAEEAWSIGVIICIIIGIIVGFVAGITDDSEESILYRILMGVWFSVMGSLGGLFGGALVCVIIVVIAPIVLGMTLGAVAGVMIGIARCNLGEFGELGVNYAIIGAVIGAIISGIGWGLESEFIVNIIFIPIFAFAGYGIGKLIKEKEEKREAIKRRREEYGRKRMRKEYEQKKKLGEYKSKIEQWKREGYDVSELEEMLK